jgi:hypothetical protein
MNIFITTRFIFMNNAIAVSAKQNAIFTVSNDPWLTRWGFNGTLREKYLNARECGVSILPYAEFFPVASFETVREIHTTDDTKPKEEKVFIPAAEAETFLMEALGGKNTMMNTPDLGLRIGFHGQDDAAIMAVISKTLLPTLPAIRQIVEMLNKEKGEGLLLENPIGSFCEGQDDLTSAERESCPTCWLNWLFSDACSEYIQYVCRTGMDVQEYDEKGKMNLRKAVKPKIADMEKALEMVSESIRFGMEELQNEWDRAVTEFEDKDRKNFTPYLHRVRKDIHAPKPAERQLQVVNHLAQQQTKATTENSNQMANMLLELAAANKQIAENQAVTNAAILKLLEDKK